MAGVASLPDHTERLLRSLLAECCTRVCPAARRGRLTLGFRIEGVTGTLFEQRRICGVPGTVRAVDLAQLRFDAAQQRWRLFHTVDYGAERPRWQRYPALPALANAAELVRALEADGAGRIWPRVNGASLRWCSPRGRCAGCG